MDQLPEKVPDLLVRQGTCKCSQLEEHIYIYMRLILEECLS